MKKILIFILIICFSASVVSAVEFKGKGSCEYKGWSPSLEDKREAIKRAEKAAWDNYIESLDETIQDNYEKHKNSIDYSKYILETNIIEDNTDKNLKKYDVRVKINIKETGFTRKLKDLSEAGKRDIGEKNTVLAFFVGRMMTSETLHGDTRIARENTDISSKRVDTSLGMSSAVTVRNKDGRTVRRTDGNAKENQTLDSSGRGNKAINKSVDSERTYEGNETTDQNTISGGVSVSAGLPIPVGPKIEVGAKKEHTTKNTRGSVNSNLKERDNEDISEDYHGVSEKNTNLQAESVERVRGKMTETTKTRTGSKNIYNSDANESINTISESAVVKKSSTKISKIFSVDNFSAAFNKILTNNGYETAEYADVLECGVPSMETIKNEYAVNNELSEETKSAIIKALKSYNCNDIAYLIIGKVDVTMPYDDRVTGGKIANARVTGEAHYLNTKRKRRIGSIDSDTYKGIASDENTAINNAVKKAAEEAAKIIINQLHSKGAY